MERPGEAADPGRPGVVRIAERGANEVRGVRGDVPTLMVRVENKVEARHLEKVVLLGRADAVHSQQVCVVRRPVQVLSYAGICPP